METKSIFANVYTSKYFKDLPDFKEKRTQAFITVALTLVTIAFFGIFAINPTVSTIVNLQKQKEDNTFVEQQLNQKFTNLNALTQAYATIQPDLPYVYRALPQTPEIPQLTGQLIALGREHSVTINRVQVFEVDLTKTQEGAQGFSAFRLSLEALGSYTNLLGYINALTSFERIIIIDNISLQRGNERNPAIKLTVQATAFFKR